VSSEEAFFGARVRALMVTLGAKDTSTEEHTRRVATLAVEIGEQMGLSRTRLRSMAIGGLLHDIGKLSIPDAILQKPGPLDDDEFAVIKTHPERGRELLEELGGFDESVTRLVLDHHERLDGRGYPRGLHADDLDLATRPRNPDSRRLRRVRRARLAPRLPRRVAGREGSRSPRV
jgi:putative nucleotidyltransferase with HDIG domain